MKKTIKYQLMDLKNVFVIYYLVYVTLMIFSSIAIINMNISMNGNTTSTGNSIDFASVIVAFVTGIAMFKDHYQISVQNSISRKTFFKSSLITFLIFSMGMTLFNVIIVSVLSLFKSLEFMSMIEMLYPRYTNLNAVIINIFYTTITFFLLFLIGFFISLCFYNANKFVKVLIAAGLPIFLFLFVPMSITFMEEFWYKFIDVFYLIMGFKDGNPLFGILTLFIVTLFFICISCPFIKRTKIV